MGEMAEYYEEQLYWDQFRAEPKVVHYVTMLVAKDGKEYERGSKKFPGNQYAVNAYMKRVEE